MEEKKQLFADWMAQEKAKCVQEEKYLIRDERKDEANLCKIRANIYDIFGALLRAAESGKGSQDDAEMRNAFLEKARQVPQNWKKSYEAAKERQDVEKVLMEETKLAAAEKIVNKFQEIWEE